jgi:hypothetical protein
MVKTLTILEEPLHIAVQSALLLAPEGKLRVRIHLDWRGGMHEHPIL